MVAAPPTTRHDGAMVSRLVVASLVLLSLLLSCDGVVLRDGDGEGEGEEGEGEGEEGEGEGEEGEGEEGEGEGEGEGEPPPPPPPTIVATPAPGFLVDVSVDVVLHVANVDATPLTLWCTTDDTAPVPGVSPSCDPGVLVDHTVGLRAIAVDDAGEVIADFFGAYLRTTPEVQALSTTVPLIVLWSTASAPQFKDEVFVPFSLSVFEPVAGVGARALSTTSSLSTRAAIKIRGSSSAGYPKHPWRVETRHVVDDDDDKVPLLGMPAESDWAFNAPLDFDRALVRNSVAFSMSNAIDRYAPRTVHAEVFVVGDGAVVGLEHNEGVYEVTELIKRGPHRVNITRLDPDDVLGDAITGGYLFKVDRTGPGENGFFAGGFNFQQPFVLDDPTEFEITSAQQRYLQQALDDIGNALHAPDFIDPRTGLHYSALLDVDSMIDHHIVNVFTKNPDAFRLSGYWFKDRNGPVNAGPVWDFDRTMGCASDGRADDPVGFNIFGDATDFLTFGYYEGLFADPAFVNAYVARLREVLVGPLSVENLHAIVDGHVANVAGVVAARHFERWAPFGYGPRGSHDDEVALLKQWLAQRHAWLLGCANSADFRTCQ
jgi:hypothetical protein